MQNPQPIVKSPAGDCDLIKELKPFASLAITNWRIIMGYNSRNSSTNFAILAVVHKISSAYWMLVKNTGDLISHR